MLKAYFFGNIGFEYNNESVNHLLSQKAKGLLCYLAINKNKPQNRDKLADLFWGSSNKDSAKYNLRYTLWSLRKTFECNAKDQKYFLMPEKNMCQFNCNNKHSIDFFNFMEHANLSNKSDITREAKITSLEKAASFYKGDFLEGFYLKSSSEFDDWVFFQRETAQKVYFEIQKSLSKEYELLKNYGKAMTPLKKLLIINPLQEELYYDLIRLLYLSGNRTGAIKEYQNCCKILRDELNIRPIKKIQELYKEVLGDNKVSIESKDKNDNSQVTTPSKKAYYLIDKFFIDKKRTSSFVLINNNGVEYQKELDYVNQILNNKDTYLLKSSKNNGFRCDYESLGEIVMSNNKCFHRIRNIVPNWCFREIKKINPELETDNTDSLIQSFSTPLEKYRIFLSLSNFFQALSRIKPLTIFIKQLHSLDRISLDFFPFLFRHCKNEKLLLVGLNNSKVRQNQYKKLKSNLTEQFKGNH